MTRGIYIQPPDAEEYTLPAALSEGVNRVVSERVDPIYRGWCWKASMRGLEARGYDMTRPPSLRDLLTSVYLQGVLDGRKVGERAGATEDREEP